MDARFFQTCKHNRQPNLNLNLEGGEPNLLPTFTPLQSRLPLSLVSSPFLKLLPLVAYVSAIMRQMNRLESATYALPHCL